MRRVASRRALLPVLLLALASSLPLSLADQQKHFPVVGRQDLVIVTVEFSDERPEHYPNVEQIMEMMGMVNDFYLELSFGQMWFEPYVTKEFYQIGPKDSYVVLTEGVYKSIGVDMLADALLAADAEVDYSGYQHIVILLVTPREYGGWLTPKIYGFWDDPALRVETGDGVVVEEAVLLQGHATTIRDEGWVNLRLLNAWIHELGHSLGLPDYGDQLEDPMMNSHLVHMLAWNKMALGWISPDKIVELSLGETTQVIVDPIERDTEGTLVLKVVKTPEHYWLVEARRPIGYDADLPTPDLAEVSLEDATRSYYWGHAPQDGVLITLVEHPSSATYPWWDGVNISRASGLYIGPGRKALFVDEEENLLIALVEEVGDSYVVEISTAEEAVEIRNLIDQARDRVEAMLLAGVASGDVEAELLEATAKCELSLESYLQYDLDSARSFVEEAQSLVDHASQLEEELRARQLYPVIGGAIAIAAIVAIAVLWIRRRKERHLVSEE